MKTCTFSIELRHYFRKAKMIKEVAGKYENHKRASKCFGYIDKRGLKGCTAPRCTRPLCSKILVQAKIFKLNIKGSKV